MFSVQYLAALMEKDIDTMPADALAAMANDLRTKRGPVNDPDYVWGPTVEITTEMVSGYQAAVGDVWMPQFDGCGVPTLLLVALTRHALLPAQDILKQDPSIVRFVHSEKKASTYSRKQAVYVGQKLHARYPTPVRSRLIGGLDTYPLDYRVFLDDGARAEVLSGTMYLVPMR